MGCERALTIKKIGTTQLQIEIGRSVSGEMLKVVDLPGKLVREKLSNQTVCRELTRWCNTGANNTMKIQTSPSNNRNHDLSDSDQQLPTEPISETTFWSELSEAFKRGNDKRQNNQRVGR